MGVESTVVNGLSDPPAILRPGGIGIEEIRALGGRWKAVTISDHDRKLDADLNRQDSRAPRIKYRHYTSRGAVFLFEAVVPEMAIRDKIEQELANKGDLKIGMVRIRC